MNNLLTQRGAVLITSLIFLLVLTLIAVVAMQSTSLEQKMSTNVAYKLQTFEDAESSRAAISSVMYPHLWEKSTWDNVTLPSGLCVTCNQGGAAMSFFNQQASDGYETGSNWDYDDRVATYTSSNINSAIFVYRTHVQSLGGVSGIGQKAYNMGTGGGASEAYYFDVRVASSNVVTGTTSTVAADYRFIRGLPPKDGIK